MKVMTDQDERRLERLLPIAGGRASLVVKAIDAVEMRVGRGQATFSTVVAEIVRIRLEEVESDEVQENDHEDSETNGELALR